MTDNSIELTVANAYPKDSWQPYVRISRETIAELSIDILENVRITGDSTTYARVIDLDNSEEQHPIVRMPKPVQHNANVEMGDTVRLESLSEPPTVDSITLQPFRTASQNVLPSAIDTIHSELQQRYSEVGMAHPLETTQKQMLLVVGQQSPEAGVIDAETEVNMTPALTSSQ